MSNENNKFQIDIDNLFKQNVNDLSSIKELYRKLKEVEEKITQIKYIDSQLANKLKKEYEKLKRIILDENAQAKLSNDIETLNENLTNDIETINEKLTNDIETINEKLTNDIDTISSQLDNKASKNEVFSMANMGQDVKEAMTGGSVAVVGKNAILSENIVNATISSDKTDFIKKGKNILNLDSLKYGFYIKNNGSLVTNDQYVTTDYIEFKKGEQLNLSRKTNESVSLRGFRFACFYDSNYNVITDLYYDNLSVMEPLKCNSEAVYYVKLTFLKGYADKNSMLYKGEEVNYIEDFYYSIDKLKPNDNIIKEINDAISNIDIKSLLKNINILSGKHIVGFGDSIVYGAGNKGYGIANIIAENNDMICENKAVGGATILKRTSNNIPIQIENYEGNPDYIILDGYINDCAFSDVLDVLGEVSPYYGGTFDTSTIIGQFETMLKDLLTRFHFAKIVYVCVHHMSSRDDSKVKKVHEKIVKACKKWSIPVVDLYEEGQLNTTINIHKEKYTDKSDSTHPNRLGYDLFYIPKIESKLKTL